MRDENKTWARVPVDVGTLTAFVVAAVATVSTASGVGGWVYNRIADHMAPVHEQLEAQKSKLEQVETQLQDQQIKLRLLQHEVKALEEEVED